MTGRRRWGCCTSVLYSSASASMLEEPRHGVWRRRFPWLPRRRSPTGVGCCLHVAAVSRGCHQRASDFQKAFAVQVGPRLGVLAVTSASEYCAWSMIVRQLSSP
jgi:hypothetical protein